MLTEIEKKCQELRAKKEAVCRTATAEIASELEQAEAELRNEAVRHRITNRQTFEKMAKEIGEAARLSFLTYVLGGYDNHFEISHHITVLEVRDEQDGLVDGWESYMDKKGNPDRESSKKVLRKTRKIYEKFCEAEQ